MCYAGCFAKRAQSGVARQVLLRRVKITMSNSKVQSGWGFPHPYPPPGHASAAGRRQTLSPQPRPGASGRDWKKSWTQLGAKTAPRSLPEAIFFDLGPILGDFCRSWTHLGANFAQHRTGKAPRCPNHPKLAPPDQQKPYKNYGFCKVFGCTPHLPKWSKMLPKSAPGPPETGQVEAKIPPNRTS